VLGVGVPVPAKVKPLAPVEHDALVNAGHALVQKQAEHVKKTIPKSGFATLEHLAKAVSAMGPSRARAVELLNDEKNFDFAMNAPEVAREGIAAAGFLNQYETKTSGGKLLPEKRQEAEAKFMNLSADEYVKVPPRVRPKYGYLRPSTASGVTMDDHAHRYGSDTFVFKSSSVKGNVTFYPCDSLYPATERFIPEARSWYHGFLPWSERMLLAPSISVEGNTMERVDLGPPEFKDSTSSYSDTFIELQYWRPLGLEDVERFEFAWNPPTGEFLAALRANGVKIFHKGQTEEWKGDAPTTPPGATMRAIAPATVPPPAPRGLPNAHTIR
jgi:hypothetical protein